MLYLASVEKVLSATNLFFLPQIYANNPGELIADIDRSVELLSERDAEILSREDEKERYCKHLGPTR